MEESTVNLYEEIKSVLATFSPTDPVTQELTAQLTVLDEPIAELRARVIPNSGLFRKLLNELEKLKTSLVKLSLRCARSVARMHQDRTELDLAVGLISMSHADLLTLLRESPAQMLGRAILTDKPALMKPREEAAVVKVSEVRPEETPPPQEPVVVVAAPAVIVMSDAEIELVLTNPSAKAFYLKHFKAKPETILAEELVRGLMTDRAENSEVWTSEAEAAVRQKLGGDRLTLGDLNLFFAAVVDAYVLLAGEKSYEGGVRGGLKHGQGNLVLMDGGRYSGNFDEGWMSGRGTFTWVDQKKYVGEWGHGEMTGRGVLTYPTGKRYDGEFRQGAMQGLGTYTWPDGRRYIGDFVNDKMQGFGVISSADGKRYEGSFRDNKKNGKGTHYWPDGARFEGDFRNDMKHGRGVLIEADGERTEGEWKDDQQTS
jgi:hypothetical protein